MEAKEKFGHDAALDFFCSGVRRQGLQRRNKLVDLFLVEISVLCVEEIAFLFENRRKNASFVRCGEETLGSPVLKLVEHRCFRSFFIRLRLCCIFIMM